MFRDVSETCCPLWSVIARTVPRDRRPASRAWVTESYTLLPPVERIGVPDEVSPPLAITTKMEYHPSTLNLTCKLHFSNQTK